MDRGDTAAAAAEAVAVAGGAEELPASLRVYVGGFGTGVTVADIEKTFSSLGRVSRVEFVQRSDSRHFAFMDFKPHSEKALAKLFATYNGCIWKGGKLKLEKAKEHYMDRLKREWDAQVMTVDYLNPSEDKLCKSSQASKPKPVEKSQIRIFFPKLKKVRALPFKGSGRHKYSFQRVEVPPLPVNFCDCEEHCRPCDAVMKEQFLSNTNTNIVVGHEELSVMNSVMAKLFSRDADKNVVDAESSKSTNRISSDAVNEEENLIETKTEVEEAEDGEEEDFVVNFGAKKSDNMMDLLQATEGGKPPTGPDGQKQSSIQQHREKKSRRGQWEDGYTDLTPLPDAKEIKSASDGYRKWFPDPVSRLKGDSETPAEKLEGSSQLQPSVELDSTDNIPTNNKGKGSTWVQKSSWKDLVGDTSSSIFSISRDSETPAEKLEGSSQLQPSVELESTDNIPTNNKGKGSTWVQKSSWKDLVGDTSSSIFSISKILTSDRAAKPRPQETCDKTIAYSTKKARKSNYCSDADFSTSTTKQVTVQRRTSESGSGEAQGKAGTVPAEIGMPPPAKENNAASNKETLEIAKPSNVKDRETSNQEPNDTPPVRIGEVCTFMRSADSQKQWTKAKTALSSYFKKKSTAESGSKRARDGSRLRS